MGRQVLSHDLLSQDMEIGENMKSKLMIWMMVMIMIVTPALAATSISDFTGWSCDGCTANATGIYLTGTSANFTSTLYDVDDFTSLNSMSWTATPSALLQYRDFDTEVVVDTGDANLLAYWTLDGDYQTSDGGLDLTGNGYAGDNFTTGAFNGEQAALFNGSQDIQSAHSNDYRIGDDGSIVAFIKVPSDEICSSGRCEIVNTRYDSQETGYSFEYRPDNDALRFRFGVAGDASQYVDSDSFTTNYELEDNTWHMVGVTFDSINDEIKFYVDGQLVGTSTGSYDTIGDQTAKMVIGAYQSEAAYFFDGAINHVAIYDDVLTEAEMTNQYYRSFIGNGIPIIYFHDVQEVVTSYLHTSYDDFKEIIDFLYDSSYTSVTMAEIKMWQDEGFTLPPRPVNIQFDDGYEGVYDLAFPYMESKGFRGTIGLRTDAVGDSGRMTYAQASTLREEYNWEIGSHSHNHLDLWTISETQQRSDFSVSKDLITENMGFVPDVFLTPFCHMNETVAAVCDDYYSICTGECNGVTGGFPLTTLEDDLTWEDHRLVINNDTSSLALAKRSINGYNHYNYWDDTSHTPKSIGSLSAAPEYFQLRGQLTGVAGQALTSIEFSAVEDTYVPYDFPASNSTTTTASLETSAERIATYIFLMLFGFLTLALAVIAFHYDRAALFIVSGVMSIGFGAMLWASSVLFGLCFILLGVYLIARVAIS